MATHLISDHYMWWDDYSVLLIYPYCWERMIECQFNSDLTYKLIVYSITVYLCLWEER